MHSTGSFLLTVIERVRAYLDEATLDAKYTNDYLVRHVICPEMVNVLARLRNTFDNPIRIRHSITLEKSTEHYILPPNVGEVYRIAILDTENRVTQEMSPRNEFNPRGPNWQLQGNMLSFRPLPGVGQSVDVHYIPNGDFQPHFDSDGGNLASSTTFVFDNAPTLGSVDRRENAYAGAILRVWDSSTDVIEERVIKSYVADTRTATVHIPFTHSTGSGRKYEVAPVGMNSLYQAIACACSINLGTARNITQKQMNFILLQYKMAMKSVGDNLSNMQARTGKFYDKKTVDNNAQLLLGE